MIAHIDFWPNSNGEQNDFLMMVKTVLGLYMERVEDKTWAYSELE